MAIDFPDTPTINQVFTSGGKSWKWDGTVWAFNPTPHDIIDSDISATANISDTKLATISTAGKVSNSATTATPNNVPDTIVLRDFSGNFEAGTITADLVGSVTGDVTGDVTGNASTSTKLATARTINGVAFDGTGDITVSATPLAHTHDASDIVSGTLAQDTTGNAATATTLETSRTISLAGDVTGSAAFDGSSDITINAVVVGGGGGGGVTGESANVPNTLVERDASGNFAAGVITANLTGDVTGNVTGDVTGNLTGDVTGNLTGNADTATSLATPRTITLDGDVSGSADFDGSTNITITTVIGTAPDVSVPFPSWNSTPATATQNNQIGAGFQDWQAALINLFSKSSIKADYTITPSGTYPGTKAFSGGVLLPGGRVFCVPHNSTEARIYDSVTDTLTTPSGTYPGNGAFSGGVLLPDGRVFCFPSTSTTARIYDPVLDTLTTPSGTYPPSSSGVLLPDGRVFTLSGIIYDPVTDTATTSSGGWGSSSGAVLLPDGKVFCVPHSSPTAAIYDPVTDTTTIPSGTYPGNRAFSGGVLMANGAVFCVPYLSSTAAIYDPTTDTVTIPSFTNSANFGFVGGVFMADGRIFCVPWNNTQTLIYDQATDTTTATQASAYAGTQGLAGGVLLPDGRVFCVPSNSTTARIYKDAVRTNLPLDDNFVLSPFVNKF